MRVIKKIFGFLIKLCVLIIVIAGAFVFVKDIGKNKLGYYEPITLKDQMQVMIKEVAVIERFENEFINRVPNNNNVLLISVLEAYNTTGNEVDINQYFSQEVIFEKDLYESEIFSVYDGPIREGKKRYMYMISELPRGIIKKGKIHGVKVSFDMGQEKVYFSGEINNEYGYQDLITNTYKKITGYQEDFDKYWANDGQGFRNLIKDRETSKNYTYIKDLIYSLQKEYQSKIDILEINLDQMGELNLITPIYPDANIKLIREALFIKNRLQAIVEIENNVDSAESLNVFLEEARKNLKNAEELNAEALKKLAKQIKDEKLNL